MATPAPTAGGRNWAELGPELLGSIVERLTAMDTIRFRAVCKAWASAAPPLNGGLYLPRAIQVPHLLLPHLAADEAGNYCTLLSLPDGRSHGLGPLPDRRTFVGSQGGWLALCRQNSRSLLMINPLTRSKIRLPSIPFPTDECIKKIVTAPNPTASSYAAVGVGSAAMAFFARAGTDEWVTLVNRDVADAIFSQGRFLTVSSDGTVHAVLLLHSSSPPAVEFTLLAPAPDPAPAFMYTYSTSFRYLVEEDSSSGDLLQVCLRTKNDIDGEGNYVSRIGGLEVWRLESGTKEWVPVKSLAGRSLFLGGCSYSLCLSARDAAGLKPKCIYLAPHYSHMVTDGVVAVYSLEDGSVVQSWTNAKPLHPWLPLWFTATLLPTLRFSAVPLLD